MLGLWFESARAMFFLFILLNALPVPMLRQVPQNRCFTCMGAPFGSNMARHSQTPFWGGPRLTFGLLLLAFGLFFGIIFGLFGTLLPFWRGRDRAAGADEDHYMW